MTLERTVTIGVLALQGAFEEHIDMLNGIQLTALDADQQPQLVKVRAIAIRLPHQLEQCDALVLPGGESTTIGKVAVRWGFIEPLREWVQKQKKPVWGTCAGMIMLSSSAKHTEEGGQTLVGGLEVEVSRNFFGAQIRSFEMDVDGPPGYQQTPYRAIFIRAPAIISVGESIQVLAQLKDAKPADGSDPADVIVAAKKENILVTAFHPEITQDDRWHRYFVEQMVLPSVMAKPSA